LLLHEKQEFLCCEVAKVAILSRWAAQEKNFLQTFSLLVVKLFWFVQVRIKEIPGGHLIKQQHLSGSSSIMFPGGENAQSTFGVFFVILNAFENPTPRCKKAKCENLCL